MVIKEKVGRYSLELSKTIDTGVKIQIGRYVVQNYLNLTWNNSALGGYIA